MPRDDAVLYQLTLIGEASKRLSDAFRSRHEDIPWADLRGMRNILIHEYHRVDLQEVWHTARHDLPILHQQLVVIRNDRPS
jgi:uncharacterized protein with HEPN domain